MSSRRVVVVGGPTLRGTFLAALWCGVDAVVEPRAALPSLRAELLEGSGYEWCPNTTATSIGTGRVVDQRGAVHAGDVVAGTRAGASVVAGVLTGAHDRAALEAAPHTHILGDVTQLAALIL